MKPRLLLSPWLHIMSTHLWLLLAVQAMTSPTITSPPPITDNVLDAPVIKCSSVPDFCKNNGVCRDPSADELWECSGDAGTGPLRCVCTPGFTGSRCETQLKCTDLSCKKTEVCDYNWSTQKLECIPKNTSGAKPTCKPGIHEKEFKVDPRDLGKQIVCFDMYEFNDSSLCSDADDSLTYLIANGGEDGLSDLFCLEVDYKYYKTCLRVNATQYHTNVITNPQARVNLYAEEYSVLERRALLQLRIILNLPPVSKTPIITWVVNTAQISTLDVISETGTTSSNTLTLSTAASSSAIATPVLINNNLTLNLTPLQNVRRLQIQLTITDNGIPQLSTNVTAQVVLVRLTCQTPRDFNVPLRDLTSSPTFTVGEIVCSTTSGSDLVYNLVNDPFQQGLTLSIKDGMVFLSRDSSSVIISERRIVIVNVSLARYPSVTTEVSFNVNIDYFSLVWFQLTSEEWKSEYQDKESSTYKTLETSLISEINGVINNRTVSTSVVQFRSAFWVDVLLLASPETLLSTSSQLLVDRVSTGTLGKFKTDVSSVSSKPRGGHIFPPSVTFITSYDTDIYFLEGTRVQAVCDVEFINPTGELNIDWTLDGAPIQPLPSSRFQLKKEGVFPWKTKSILDISSVQFTDKGELRCTVSDVTGKTSTGTLNLNILFKPEIRITSFTPTRFVEKDTELTLTCSVVAPTVSTMFSWKKNGIQFRNVSSITETISADTNFTCIGSNGAGSGQGKTTRVILIPGVTACPAITDIRNTVWLKTTPGVTAELLCPADFTGMVSRYCSVEGSWSEPDYSACVQTAVRDIEAQIKKLEAGIKVSEPETLVANLSAIIETSVLGEQEVLSITKAIADLTSITTESQTIRSPQQKQRTKQFATAAVNLVGNLIDPKQNIQNVTTSQNISVSVMLLDTLDKVSKIVGDNVPDGQTETIVTKNIALTVGKTNPFNITDISYPPVTPSGPVKLSATLPSGIFKVGSDFEPIVYSMIAYTNFSSLPETVNSNLTKNDSTTTNKKKFEINSDVLSINIFPGNTGFDSSRLNADVLFKFSHLNTTYDSSMCSYWDVLNSNWNNAGCRLLSTNQNLSTCSCNHLTSFALLMKPTSTISPEHKDTLSTITLIGCTISICCLLFTVLTYAFVWRYVRSDRAILLINLCVALIIALVLFLFGVDKTSNKTLCTAISVGLHYFYLVVFFLMLAEGIEVLVSIVKVFSSRSKLKELIIMGWGAPLVIVGISTGVTQFKGYGNDTFCWLSINDGLIWAFVGPALTVILVNFIIVFKITCSLLQTRVMINKDLRIKAKAALRSICVLLPIMGVAWIFGILAVSEDLIIFDYIFTVLNTLQGLFIFIFHCIINRKVQEGLANRRRRYRSRHTDLSGPSSRSAYPPGGSGRRNYGESSTDEPEAGSALKDGYDNRGFIASRYASARGIEYPKKRPIERLSYPSNHNNKRLSYLNSFPEERSEGYSTLSVGDDDPTPIIASQEASKQELTQEHFKPALMRGYSGLSGGGYSDRSGSLNSDDMIAFSGLPRPRLHMRPFS